MVEIPDKQFASMAIALAFECPDPEISFPRDRVEQDTVLDEVHPSNVTSIEMVEEYVVEVRGESTVPLFVKKIPASGGGRLEPPTNPPEVVTEDAEMWFDIRIAIDELPYCEHFRVEV